MTNSDLFDLEGFSQPKLFNGVEYPWEVLQRLIEYLKPLCKDQHSQGQEGAFIDPEVIIGEGTIVEPGAVIKGPTIIGKRCIIRAGAYIRGSVLIEDDVLIGHASEIKNSIIFQGAQIAHFNYIGDSVIGVKAHFAAGAIIANLKLAPGNVIVRSGSKEIDTGLRKFGAGVGDQAEVGINAVLNPGSIVGKHSLIYPLTSWRGVLEPNKIAKSPDIVVDRTQ